PEGRLQLAGAPAELLERLNGRVWRKTIAKSELAAVQARHEVMATRLFAGRTVVHILSDKDPQEGFERSAGAAVGQAGWDKAPQNGSEPIAGGIEDVYFATLSAARRAPKAA